MSLFDALRFTPGARAALEMALEDTAVAFGEAEVFYAEAAIAGTESSSLENPLLI